MRIVFMGTPDFAVPALGALVAAGHEIVAVYSQPPRPSGRGKSVTPSPVQARAEALGLPVLTPVSLRDAAAQAAFAGHGADVAVVAAYGLILPQAVLDAPRLGCLNIHASLLPRWRGAAPVQRAILAGDEVTGITIMQMERGLDTGPVLTMAALKASGDAGRLTEQLAMLGADLIAQVLDDPESYPKIPQLDEGATYAAKISKDEAKLDFSESAIDVVRAIRAFAPSPGAWFEFGGQRLRILAARVHFANSNETPPGTIIGYAFEIQCGVGSIEPILIQRAGAKVMRVQEYRQGNPIPAFGTRL